MYIVGTYLLFLFYSFAGGDVASTFARNKRNLVMADFNPII